jgi:uncharacterized membrane protein
MKRGLSRRPILSRDRKEARPPLYGLCRFATLPRGRGPVFRRYPGREAGGVLSSITASPEVHALDAEKRRRAVLIVVACTLIIPLAQYLIKLGANQLAAKHLANGGHAGSVSFQTAVIGIFTNPALFSGYCLYGIFTVLFVVALRHGELSILYPLISLSYVWVAITAAVALHEAMNPLKLMGIAIIMAGVTVLGRGSGK